MIFISLYVQENFHLSIIALSVLDRPIVSFTMIHFVPGVPRKTKLPVPTMPYQRSRCHITKCAAQKNRHSQNPTRSRVLRVDQKPLINNQDPAHGHRISKETIQSNEPIVQLTKSPLVNEKTTRSQYLMRANLNVRPLVDIVVPSVTVAIRACVRGPPEKRKKEENKMAIRARVRRKNADIMQVIIIIMGYRALAPPAPIPIFIQMCLVFF